MEMLDINGELEFETSITGIELRDHEAYAGARYGNTDEIRIESKNQDDYTLPCESLLYLEGKVLAKDKNAVKNTKLVKNFLAHMIQEIKYKINDVEIDQTRNVGVGSTIKGLVSFSSDQVRALTNGGWSSQATCSVLNDGYFNVALPLSTRMGFFEDYKKILMNCKQELIILRSQSDSNSIITTVTVAIEDEQASIEITKFKWKMPHVQVDDETKLKLLSQLRSDRPITIGFRSWFVAEKPMPTTTTRDEWQLQSMTSIERPRFILLVFQTAKRNKTTSDVNIYDHCNIRNVKAYINGKSFPYVDMNLDFNQKQCAMLYNSYTAFQKSYYGVESKPLLSYSDFLSQAPIFVIDCSKQNESIKGAPVDVRLEIEAKSSFAANTTAYCVIIHDRVIEYSPFTNLVRRHI
jgi:hypothetical protein